VRVRESDERGWYTATFVFAHGTHRIQLLKKVDPRTEAARLRALAAGIVGAASAARPGIAGHQQRARAATASKQAARLRAEGYARVLEGA
jgi:hypothetical protein